MQYFEDKMHETLSLCLAGCDEDLALMLSAGTKQKVAKICFILFRVLQSPIKPFQSDFFVFFLLFRIAEMVRVFSNCAVGYHLDFFWEGKGDQKILSCTFVRLCASKHQFINV